MAFSNDSYKRLRVLGGILGALLLVLSTNQGGAVQFCASRIEGLSGSQRPLSDASSLLFFKKRIHKASPVGDLKGPEKIVDDLIDYLDSHIVPLYELRDLEQRLRTGSWRTSVVTSSKIEALLNRLPILAQRNFDALIKRSLEDSTVLSTVTDDLGRSLESPEAALAAAEGVSYLLTHGNDAVRSGVAAWLPEVEWSLHTSRMSSESQNASWRDSVASMLRAAEVIALTGIAEATYRRIHSLLQNPQLPETSRKRLMGILSGEPLAMLESLEVEAFLLTRAASSPYPEPEELTFKKSPTRERILSWAKIKDPVLYLSFISADQEISDLARKVASLLYVEAEIYYQHPTIIGERRRDVTLIFSRYPQLLEAMRKMVPKLEWEIENRQSR